MLKRPDFRRGHWSYGLVSYGVELRILPIINIPAVHALHSACYLQTPGFWGSAAISGLMHVPDRRSLLSLMGWRP